MYSYKVPQFQELEEPERTVGSFGTFDVLICGEGGDSRPGVFRLLSTESNDMFPVLFNVKFKVQSSKGPKAVIVMLYFHMKMLPGITTASRAIW